jgi:hypothetical protein
LAQQDGGEKREKREKRKKREKRESSTAHGKIIEQQTAEVVFVGGGCRTLVCMRWWLVVGCVAIVA